MELNVEQEALPPEQLTRTRSSLLQYAPLLVLTLIIVGNLWQKTDPDLWGHIRFGQTMLSARQIVAHDQFSYTVFNHSWRDHEYLTEIIMALIYDATGVVGLKIWKLACVAATVLLLVEGLAATATNTLIQLAVLGFTVCSLAQFNQFRPQLHTYLLFALTLALLARDTYRGSAPLWLMIPIMWLWTNLHGGFVIGVIALTIYSGTVGITALYSHRCLRHAGRLGAIAFASATATLLPPCGLNTWRAVLTTLGNPLTFKIFTEWQPLSTAMREQWQFNHFGIVAYLFLLVVWAGLAVSLTLRPCASDLPLVLIAVAMSVGALRSVRNVPLAAIACAIPAARHLELLLHSGLQVPRTHTPVSNWAQYALVLTALLLVNREIFSRRLPTDMNYPLSAVNFMKEHQLRGNVLVYFCWGEYLIWHLAPDSRVFFDSRYDMVYPSRVTQDYLTFFWGMAGDDKVLRAYKHDFVLFRITDSVYDRMLKTTGWRLIYRDNEAALFARIGSRAARLVHFPVIANAPAVQYFP